MFIISAPALSPQTQMVLPSPRFGDSRARTNAMNLYQSMNGTLRTYVKSLIQERISYSFKVSRAKAEEFYQFMLLYLPYEMTFINHKDETWRVLITNDPTIITFDSPSETATLTIDAEGYKL